MVEPARWCLRATCARLGGTLHLLDASAYDESLHCAAVDGPVVALKRDPGWRDEAAATLLARHATRLAPRGPVLVMEDPRDEAADALAGAGGTVVRWWRRAIAGRPASAWPPPGPFDLVALRLPKAKDELEMAVQAAAGALAPHGTLVVYGAKDEGIGSAGRRIEAVTRPVRTVATGGHCRLLAAGLPDQGVGRPLRLADFRVETDVGLAELPDPWISYPGVFAHGRLDKGTGLLLDHLPPPAAGERVLDFGCGSGLIAGVYRARARAAGMDIAVDGVDVDAVALVALSENVPGARPVLADGLEGLTDEAYTLILSNPPYHVGKAESTDTLAAFVAQAPRVLAPGGRLVLVVQRRLPVERMLAAAFPTVRPLTGDATYRVWEAARR